jgi:hypothetical protein
MAGFQYGKDIGVPSYPEIERFCRQSGVDFRVSSTTSGGHVSGSYHYKGNAEDLVSSAGSMQQLAGWLLRFYPFWLELIHSGGPGYFVKNGEIKNASYFGASVVAGHYNHVHFAATLSGLSAAEQAGASGYQTATDASWVSQEAKGCFVPAMLAVAGFGGTVVTAIGAVHGW